MGLLNQIEDVAIKKITKKETVRLSCDELVKIVKEEFIYGADDEYLKKVCKTAKGGSVITKKQLVSANGRYKLEVGNIQRGMMFGIRKTVWVFDDETNKFYQLEKDRHWKKFYKATQSAINLEKINRDR